MTRRLREEIKQTKPFGSLEEEVFVGLQRTADALGRVAAEVLRPVQLSVTQYNVLRILRGAGADGVACREVGERMITRDPDLTRLLDRLEARGLVARARGRKDRRVVLTRITEEGLKLLRGLDQAVTESHRAALGHLGERRLKALAELLDRARRPGGR